MKFLLLKNYLRRDVYFIFIPSIFTTFLPFFLITGPFLPDLAISICGLLFLINYLTGGLSDYKSYFLNYFFLIFVSFWIVLIVSSFLSNNIFYSLQTSFFYIRFIFFSLSTWFLLRNNNKFIYFFFISLVLTLSILIFDGFFQFFIGKNLFGWPIIDSRVSSFFKDELILGSYLSRMIPLGFAIFIFLDQSIKLKYLKQLFLLIFLLSEVLIFFSGERVSFFYINLSSFFMILLCKNYSKIRLTLIIFTIFFITLLSFYDSKYKERIFDKTLEQTGIVNINNIQKKIYVFSEEHENHYKSALLMFKDNIILGIGPKLFRKNCNKKNYEISNQSCSTHPHNTYIQLLAEVGLVGFFFIFFIFFYLIIVSLKQFIYKYFKKNHIFNDFQLALMSCILITLWPLAPTGNFFGNYLNVLYYLPVGFLLFAFDKKNNK